MDANKTPSQRQTQISLEVRSIAQDFFQRESSGASLITVTRAEVSPDVPPARCFPLMHDRAANVRVELLAKTAKGREATISVKELAKS